MLRNLVNIRNLASQAREFVNMEYEPPPWRRAAPCRPQATASGPGPGASGARAVAADRHPPERLALRRPRPDLADPADGGLLRLPDGRGVRGPDAMPRTRGQRRALRRKPGRRVDTAR